MWVMGTKRERERWVLVIDDPRRPLFLNVGSEERERRKEEGERWVDQEWSRHYPFFSNVVDEETEVERERELGSSLKLIL